MQQPTAPIPERILPNCGTCRFWTASHHDPTRGDCQLANGTMSTGDDQPVLMQVQILAETVYDFATASDPDATLSTARTFRCSHWDILGTLDQPEDPDDATLTLPERFRNARLAAGLTLAQISKLVGESKNSGKISRFEAGTGSLTWHKLASAAVAMGVSTDHLLGLTQDS